MVLLGHLLAGYREKSTACLVSIPSGYLMSSIREGSGSSMSSGMSTMSKLQKKTKLQFSLAGLLSKCNNESTYRSAVVG